MSFKDPAFSLAIGQKLNWQQFIDKLTIKHGGINFQNADSRITVNNLSWFAPEEVFGGKRYQVRTTFCQKKSSKLKIPGKPII